MLLKKWGEQKNRDCVSSRDVSYKVQGCGDEQGVGEERSRWSEQQVQCPWRELPGKGPGRWAARAWAEGPPPTGTVGRARGSACCSEEKRKPSGHFEPRGAVGSVGF